MYSKLYASIVMSSLWSEPSDTCKVFMTMLAMADPEGYVWGSAVGVAALARLPLPTVEGSLRVLESPDPHSGDLDRNPEYEGRRIETVPGGWRIINYKYYRDLERSEDRRLRKRLEARRRRARSEDGGSGLLSPEMATVAKCRPNDPSESESDIETVSLKGLSLSEGTGETDGRRAQSRAAALATLPLRDGSEYEVAEAELKKLVEVYPNVDVRGELSKMETWCERNRTRRKTKAGVGRFITNWLSAEDTKAKARLASGRGPRDPASPERKAEYSARPKKVWRVDDPAADPVRES